MTDTSKSLAAVMRARDKKEIGTAEFYLAITKAREDGASLAEIAKVAGLSRQRIHQIVGLMSALPDQQR